jgi:hypothetical protein
MRLRKEKRQEKETANREVATLPSNTDTTSSPTKTVPLRSTPL